MISRIVGATTSNKAVAALEAPGPGRRYLIHSVERVAPGIHEIKYTIEEADTMTTTTPAKRGRKPGTPNPNGGRHPGTQAKTRVDLTAEAAELLAEFAQRVNEARGQATRQDEIASAVIVRYLTEIDPGMKFSAGAIAGMIDKANAQEAGTP